MRHQYARRRQATSVVLASTLGAAALVLGPFVGGSPLSATPLTANPLTASINAQVAPPVGPEGFDVDAPFTVVGEPIYEDPHIDTEDGKPLTPSELAEIEELTTKVDAPDLPPGFAFATSDQIFDWSGPGDVDVTLTAKSAVPDAAIDIVHESFVEFREFVDLDLAGAASHNMEIFWTSLPSSTLASASTTYILANQNGEEYLIPLFLADVLTGTNNASAPAMRIYINADFAWDLTLEPTDRSINSHYLKSVMLHEVGHGLGFTSAFSSPGDAAAARLTPWSEHLYVNQDLAQPWSAARGSRIQTGNMWFLNSDGTWERVYDPSGWQTGSSFSHLDESTYRPNFGAESDPGTLMSPASGAGEISRVDGVVAGVLSRLGYETFASPDAPGVSVDYAANTTVVTVAPGDGGALNVPAKLWLAEVRTTGGTLLTSVTVNATTRTISLPGQLAAGEYQLVLTADVDGNTASVTTTFTAAESPSTATSPTTTSPTTSPSTTTGPPFYANCEQVRAAGEAPILSTSPSFRSVFDTDHDGIGCEQNVTIGPDEPSLSTDSPQVWYRFQIARLYVAYFSRYPEKSGWEYWNSRFVSDEPLAEMSDFFAQSIEYEALYGRSQSNADFVGLIYENVLQRDGEPGGMAFWTAQLDQGLSRGELMIGFSESAEFIFNAGPSSTNTCWSATSHDDVIGIRNSYACAAGETPDPT